MGWDRKGWEPTGGEGGGRAHEALDRECSFGSCWTFAHHLCVSALFHQATLFLWRHFLRLGVSVPPVAVVSVVEAALAMDLRAAGVADALKLALAAVETLPAASRSARFYTSVVRAHVALGSASNALAASEEATKAEIVLPKEVQDAVTKLGVSSVAVSSGPLLDKASK